MGDLTISNHGAGTSHQHAIIPNNANKKAPKRKRNDADGVQYFLRTRMSPNMLVEFINSGLSEKQVSDIKDMGFGGLLTLKADTVPGALGYWLVTNFNSVSCSYMKGQFHITDEDVHLATGIPIGGTDVNIASQNDNSEDFLQLKSDWLKQFDTNSPKITTKQIFLLLMTQKEGGEDFKRNFIVFVVSVFLMGVKGAIASLRVLKCLRDVSSIQTLNWSKFTRKHFIESVDSWRQAKSDVFGGPIMVIVFCYLDRVSYKFFSVPRVFPILATWTSDIITERVNNEMVDGFGSGSVIPRIMKGQVPEVSFDAPESSNQQNKESESKDRNVMKELAESAVFLADAYARFLDSLTRAKGIAPDSKFVQQLNEMAEALSECCPSSEPKDTTNCDVNNKAHDTGKDKENEGVANTDENNSEESCPWSKLNGQSFDSEDELWSALIRLETALGKRPANVKSNVMKKGKSFTSVDTKAQASTSVPRSPRSTHQPPPAFRQRQSPLPETFTPPSFKLLSSESEEDGLPKMAHVEKQEKSANFVDSKANVVMQEKSAKLVDSKATVEKQEKSSAPIFVDSESQEFIKPLKPAQASTSVRRSPRFRQFSEPEFTPLPCPLPDPFTSPSTILLSSESQEDAFQKLVDDALNINVNVPLEVEPVSSMPPNEPTHIKMSRAKRIKVQTEAFRSPFLQRSIKLDGKMSKIEKEVLEHVFSEFSCESQILFKSGTTISVTRGDFKTLLSGDKVPEQVIQAWCCLLNKGETIRASTSPSRLYLPQSAGLGYEIDDNFTGAALIFVPVSSEKPFVLCFNFLQKKLEILHVMKAKSINYAPIIESTKQFVIRCLKNKMPSIVDVRDMKVEEIILKSNIADGTDSGIYLMRLLEKYKGERRNCSLGLQSNNQVKLFGTRACYEMLSSDANHLKVKVLKDAGSFSLDIRHEVSNQAFQNPKQTRSATKSRRQLTDTELLGLVIKRCNDVKYLDEDFVATEWMNVSQAAIKSLLGTHWIHDSVIDMFGVMCTYNRQDILYLPSTVRLAKPGLKVTESKFIWCPYLKMHYKPQNGATIDKVFFTIGKDNNHWLAYVSDLKKKKNYILDSLRSYKKSDWEAQMEYNTYVENIIVNVVNQIPCSNGYKRLKAISLFETENVDVPQQPNTFDCGVYVMKYLEAAMFNTDLWKDQNFYQNMVGYRREIILRLIKWEENTAQMMR